MRNFTSQSFSLNNVGDWPHSIKWTVIIISSFFVLLLGYCLIIKQVAQDLAVAKQQQKILKQTFFAKQQAIKNLPLLQKQVQELQQVIAAQINNNMDVITELGTQADVNFTGVKLLPEINTHSFVELPVQLTLSSDYQQVRRFITVLAQAEYLIGIKSFVVNAQEINCVIEIYHGLQPNKKLIANTSRENTSIANPFHTAAANTLDNFPLHALHMVGVVQQDKKIWALITAPDGKVYAVTVGANLGNEGKVVHIDAQKIVIAKENKTIILGLIKHE